MKNGKVKAHTRKGKNGNSSVKSHKRKGKHKKGVTPTVGKKPMGSMHSKFKKKKTKK